MGDVVTVLIDCEAALCLDPNHKDTLDLYSRTRGEANHQQKYALDVNVEREKDVIVHKKLLNVAHDPATRIIVQDYLFL
ncbi:hypothetical protein AgCh_020418 [Apium graveolens]